MAAGLDARLEAGKDKQRIRTTNNLGAYTVDGADATSDLSKSASGVPGYYHSQNSAADTRTMYRAAAANPASGPAAQLAAIGGLDPSLLQGFKVDLTQADINFLETRRQEKLQVDFDTWLGSRVALKDPLMALRMQQVFPEYWDRRQKVIDDQIAVEARAAKIRLRGPQDKEDYLFLYSIDKGYVELPTTTAFNWSRDITSAATYREGMFSIFGTNKNLMIRRADKGPFQYGAAFQPRQRAQADTAVEAINVERYANRLNPN